MDKQYINRARRSRKGSGRREEISSIRVPVSIKTELEAWKSAYEMKHARKITYEQMFRWWMDNIGYTDEKWDEEIRQIKQSKLPEYIFQFNTKDKLVKFLNRKGRFWEYRNQATAELSDKEVITKALLYLELEDMPQLFALFGYDACKEVFNKEIEPRGKYYGNVSSLLKAYYF